MINKPSEEMRLNEEQLSAVRYNCGPLLIIAGAGTGKTTVVTERIKHLILDRGVLPGEILALTFTEKAAKEMEDRVDVALPYGYLEMWIMTFHSFCDRILRDSSLNIGLDPKFRLMTEAESIQLIRKNLFKFDLNYFRPLGNPNKFISGLLQHFSRLQDEDISPSDYKKWVSLNFKNTNPLDQAEKMEADKFKELAKVYEQYSDLKIKEGVLDFGDLIVNTLKIFRDRPNILKEYQNKFKHILVDEFQDTNYAQYELLKLLSGTNKNANITAVGDDSQSVYKFRGAAISNILSFRKDYKNAKTITLIKNYRSTQTILDSAYKLIKHNDPDTLEAQLGINKRLISQLPRQKGEKIKFIHADRVENEAEEIAREIAKLTSEKKYNFQDIAILVRANNHSEPIMQALTRHSIPHQFLGPGRLFKQPEVIDLIAYLKVLYNFEDSVSFYRLLSIDQFDISGRTVIEISNYSRKNNISLFEAAERLQEKTGDEVSKLVSIIHKHQDLISKESAGQILYRFLEETEILKKLLLSPSPNSEIKALNISKFFDKLKSYESSHTDSSVPSVVDWLDLSMELGESPLAANTDWTETDSVNILTVHSAKGLEFPVVFLVNLVAQRFPTTERREQIPIPDGLIKEVLPIGDYHLEEERRLFYVGLTRAKEKVYLTAADFYGEGKREKKLSPFIEETLDENYQAGKKISKNETNKSSIESYQTKLDTKHPQQAPGLKIDYLSYSQIETFNICPLHYQLRYIYKVPTPPSASASFGTSIHSALKDFYLKVGNNTGLKDNKNKLERLLADLLIANWVKEGFSDKLQEKEFLKKGRDYLMGFLVNVYDPKLIPIALEQKFSIPIGDNLKVGGVIDRIDDLGSGEIEIIDYKTGATIPSQKDVDQNLQLSLYALAATKIHNFPFGRKPDGVKLSLYFLDTQEKLSTKKTPKQLEDACKDILLAKEKIEHSDFNCSNHMFCQMGCEYSLFCNSED